MFHWLRRKEETITNFDDNEAAFAHACTVGYPLLIGALIPGLITAKGGLGTEGEQRYQLQLAGSGGVLEMGGCTMADAPAVPEVGDFVAFRIVRIATELPEDANLIGYIACRLEPVLVGKRKWRIAASFTPSHLKPDLHL